MGGTRAARDQDNRLCFALSVFFRRSKAADREGPQDCVNEPCSSRKSPVEQTKLSALFRGAQRTKAAVVSRDVLASSAHERHYEINSIWFFSRNMYSVALSCMRGDQGDQPGMT